MGMTNELEKVLELKIKAKHFEDYSPSFENEFRNTTIGYTSLCILSDAYQDTFGRESDFQADNDPDFNLMIDCTLENELDKEVVYRLIDYDDDTLLSDYSTSKKLKWNETVIRRIKLTLIEE